MNIRGTGVAVITPFDQAGKIDEKAFRNLLIHLMKGKVEYLVLLGTTAESPSLSIEEKKRIIAIAQEETAGSIPLVIGIGGSNTSQVLTDIDNTDFTYCQGILSVCPYYNKPDQEGLLKHFEAIADHSPVPLIIYNVPGRTGKNVEADTTLELARHRNIQGIKEASGDPGQVMDIIHQKPNDFQVVSGDDDLTLAFIGLGMDGVISVAANAFPLEFSAMVRAGLNNEFDQARSYHYNLLPYMKLAFEEGNPTGIKAILNIKELCENNLRLPLVPSSDELYGKLQSLL